MKAVETKAILEALARIETALAKIDGALAGKGKAACIIRHRLPPPPPDEPEPAAG